MPIKEVPLLFLVSLNLDQACAVIINFSFMQYLHFKLERVNTTTQWDDSNVVMIIIVVIIG